MFGLKAAGEWHRLWFTARR